MATLEELSRGASVISLPGKPLAEFLCPGHPLLEATIDLIVERHRDLLKRGAILVDDTDAGQNIRTFVFLEHAIQDARTDRSGSATSSCTVAASSLAKACAPTIVALSNERLCFLE